MKKMKMRTLARNGRFFSAANTLRSHRRGGYYPPEHLRFWGIFEKKGAVHKSSFTLSAIIWGTRVSVPTASRKWYATEI